MPANWRRHPHAGPRGNNGQLGLIEGLVQVDLKEAQLHEEAEYVVDVCTSSSMAAEVRCLNTLL